MVPAKSLVRRWEEYRVPKWYATEKTEVPGRNIGVPPVRRYANSHPA